MITSSLPPELKVMIASGFLLGGVLLALRFPAEHDGAAAVVAQSLAAENNAMPSSLTMPFEPASVASGSEAVSCFEQFDNYINRSGNSETPPERTPPNDGWMPTSLSEPDFRSNGDMSSDVAEPLQLDPNRYADMAVNPVHDEVVPDYKPFQTTTHLSMSAPNPEFFEALPSPPILNELPRTFETAPGNIISPSASILPVIVQSGMQPLTTPPVVLGTNIPGPVSLPVTATAARPATPVMPIPVDREPRGEVISAPARTTILPNIGPGR